MLFAVTTEQFNLGPTFLIWSVHYVTGNDYYYDIRTNTKKNIPSNPLGKGTTAHKMSPTYCRSYESFSELSAKLSKDSEMNHIKFVPKVDTLEQYHTINRKIRTLSKNHKVKVINISLKNLQHLIGFLRHDYEKADWQKDIAMVKSHCRHYWPHFFNNKNIFHGRLNIWHDIREQIAFNLRPDDFWKNFGDRKATENVYDLSFEELLKDGQAKLLDIIKFIGCEPKANRIDIWSQIHKTWSSNLEHYVDFCNDLDTIVDAIVTNKNMDIKKYKMDVLKEGVVLHYLMFRHNLNFQKDLDQFPNNTKKIFDLLGKNHRIGIEKLYFTPTSKQ